MATRYARTLRCEKFLQKSGFEVISMWSCEFEPRMRRDPLLVEEARLTGALHPRLLPRDGYYGGRVEYFKLYHECKPNEEIRYYDFNGKLFLCHSLLDYSPICSPGLYPTCMLTNTYYVGVPEIIRNKFEDLSNYRGLIYGRFLCTDRSLFIPCLPSRENGKLFFANCSTCCREKNKTACQHTDSERAITTIVTTEEWQMAAKRGYVVHELFEVDILFDFLLQKLFFAGMALPTGPAMRPGI